MNRPLKVHFPSYLHSDKFKRRMDSMEALISLAWKFGRSETYAVSARLSRAAHGVIRREGVQFPLRTLLCFVGRQKRIQRRRRETGTCRTRVRFAKRKKARRRENGSLAQYSRDVVSPLASFKNCAPTVVSFRQWACGYNVLLSSFDATCVVRWIQPSVATLRLKSIRRGATHCSRVRTFSSYVIGLLNRAVRSP